MLDCPKCGTSVREDYDFCPKCGAALKPAPPHREEKYEKREKEERLEKREKGEKREKAEKYEKYEKRELSYLASLVGGLILICIGLMFYVATQLVIRPHIWLALFFIIIGIIVLIAGVYAVTIARGRSPQP